MSEEQREGRKPDLVNDRFTVVHGGVLGVIAPAYIRWPIETCAVIGKIPVHGEPAGAYPRDPCFRMMADVDCGTVDELVAVYRERLVAALKVTFMLDSEVEPPKDPTPVKAWLENEKRQEWLKELGYTSFDPVKANTLLTARIDGPIAKPRRDKREVMLAERGYTYKLSRKEIEFFDELFNLGFTQQWKAKDFYEKLKLYLEDRRELPSQ